MFPTIDIIFSIAGLIGLHESEQGHVMMVLNIFALKP
jgi:hypothetical protein